MPRGRETLREYLRKVMERIERVPSDEPWSALRFPRQDARKRVVNASNSKRIVFTVDPVTYSQFHEHKERIMRYASMEENPVKFGVFVIDLLAVASEEFVERWQKAHEGHAEQES